jgi:hypothetical protein
MQIRDPAAQCAPLRDETVMDPPEMEGAGLSQLKKASSRQRRVRNGGVE